MKDIENKVENFYSRINFPGSYSLDDLAALEKPTGNYYLDTIEQFVEPASRILDAGCGSGLVTNLMAMRWPAKVFVGHDFSQSIDIAQKFAVRYGIDNVSYRKRDLTKFEKDRDYDLIICQGVLHHIPNYRLALHNLLATLSPFGHLILGVYHPWGKWLQKTFDLNYEVPVLQRDQLENPFEICFTHDQLEKIAPAYYIRTIGPRILGSAALASVAKARSGAIVLYRISHQ